MLNKIRIAVATFLLIAAMMCTPVLAIGPFQAVDVGNNPNLTALSFPEEVARNWRGEAGGYMNWAASDIKSMFFDASAGQGKANNAVQANMATLSEIALELSGDAQLTLENKWIYLSPEGSGNQFTGGPLGTHGMLWWFTWGISGHNVAVANQWASLYPDGAFWQFAIVK